MPSGGLCGAWFSAYGGIRAGRLLRAASGASAPKWSTSVAVATYGIVNAPGIGWLNSGTQQCNSGVSRLYCIGDNPTGLYPD